MIREFYNFSVAYAKAFYKVQRVLEVKRGEIVLLGGNLKEIVSQPAIAGNAVYTKKVAELIDFEKNMNSKFECIIDALNEIEDVEIRSAVLEAVVKEQYIPCKLGQREIVKLKIELLKKIAINFTGAGFYKEIESTHTI